MSTTFAIRVPRQDYEDEEDFPNGYQYQEVAFRSSSQSRWLNALAPLLPDDMPIEPMDNSAQGIHTIGDFKKLLNQ